MSSSVAWESTEDVLSRMVEDVKVMRNAATYICFSCRVGMNDVSAVANPKVRLVCI